MLIKRLLHAIFMPVFLTLSLSLLAQDRVVTGKVTDSKDNSPVAGASVQPKGSKTGTSTSADGSFSIAVPAGVKTLVVSSAEFDQQEVDITDKTTVDVSMVAKAAGLTEVVVIGYGTASKRDLTGSIAKVAGKDLADKPNANPLSSIQGKVAGVSVVNSGELGKEPDVRIRGTISRTQTKPLYVVDGIFTNNIDFLNPIDIESMEILKDPSSLAIFGVKGAAGVIAITTKRAKAGQVVINFNSSYGFKKLVDKIELADAATFKTLFEEEKANLNTITRVSTL